jgi:hypothetical protein
MKTQYTLQKIASYFALITVVSAINVIALVGAGKIVEASNEDIVTIQKISRAATFSEGLAYTSGAAAIGLIFLSAVFNDADE